MGGGDGGTWGKMGGNEETQGCNGSGCNVRIRLQPRLLPTAFTAYCPLFEPMSADRPHSQCLVCSLPALSLQGGGGCGRGRMIAGNLAEIENESATSPWCPGVASIGGYLGSILFTQSSGYHPLPRNPVACVHVHPFSSWVHCSFIFAFSLVDPFAPLTMDTNLWSQELGMCPSQHENHCKTLLTDRP